MAINKRLINTGGGATPAPFDPLANFETVTYTGTGASQKINGYIRKGAAFNGSSSKIVLPDVVSSLIDTAQAFTISMWFNISGGSGRRFLYFFGRSTYIYLEIESDNTLRAVVNASGGSVEVDDSTVLSNNVWYNAVLTGSNAANLTLYLNGSSVGTTSWDGTFGGASGVAVNIGNENNALYFNGKIDQVRIFNTAITQANVNTLYAETYASATKSTTDIFGNGSGIALYEMEDNSLSSNFGQAAVFNGSSSGISIPLNVVSVSSAYTVSLWFNAVNVGVNTGIFSNQGTSAISNQIGINIISSTQINLASIVNNGSNTVDIIAATVPTMSSNTWNNLVVIADRSLSNKVKLYLNGVEASNYNVSASAGSNTLYSTAQIGRSDGRFINGKLDQVRLFNATLAQVDITKLYKESSQIPTTNLVAHYTLNGNALDSAGSNNGTETSITYASGVYGGTDTGINYLGMAFSPSLIWIKQRSGTRDHIMADTVRGGTGTYPNQTNFNLIYPYGTFPQDTNVGNQFIRSIQSNGFTIGNHVYVSEANQTYVAWCWRAGGAAVSNTDGTITSSVSANVDAGFSIVKHTGNGSTGTVGHGLSSTPELIIRKSMDGSYDWWVYVSQATPNFGYLNHTDAFSSNNNSAYSYNQSQPTSSVFSVGNDYSGNINGDNHIAYCFHSVAGYQKVGNYNGTGNSGNAQNVGFEPRFILGKSYDNTEDWFIVDSVRGGNKYLRPNTATSESTAGAYITFTSTGFQFTGGSFNNSGMNFIYLAIA